MRSGTGSRSGFGGSLTTMLRFVVALVISAVVVPPAVAAVAGMTLLRAPLPGELPDERPSFEAVPSIVVDRNGKQIAVFRGFDRTVEITADDVPEIMNQAVVAIEDRRFYEHDGIDYEGIARAARTDLVLGEIVQGGSTITQQYVKNTYLSGERTFERKFREALLATKLEQQLTKDEILFRYLESSYFGAGAYGVGAAAEVYFGKPVNEIDISEAATLAGLLQAPTRLSPRVDIEAAEARRRLVLQAMLDVGYITEKEHGRQAARTLWSAADSDRPEGVVTVVVPPPVNGASDHPFFVDWIEQELLDRFGPDLVYRGGLQIETTIDPRLQRQAEAAVAARLANTEYPVEMSLVSLDPRSGEVLAMVGGRDYEFSQVNLATGGTTGFQPGSSFKPIVLAEAFRQGIGPDTIYPAPATWDVPGCSGSQCTISNYDNQSRGEITLRDATEASVNTVFAQLITDVSIERTKVLARQLGLERIDPNGSYGASLALGAAESSSLEMASAYGTFANQGVRIAPTGLVSVVDPDGNVLLDNSARSGTRVLSSAVANNVTDVLAGVVTNGTGPRASLGERPVAGKTGTGQAYRAAWFVGYTPSLSTAIWMGHADKLRSLTNVNGVSRVTGGSHPAIAFAQFMAAALEGTAIEQFPEPEPLEQVESADDVIAREQEHTVAGVPSQPVIVNTDCGGPCERDLVPQPSLDPPPVTAPTTTTTTLPPTTALPPTTVSPTTTGPATTTPSSSNPNTTATTSTSTTTSPSTTTTTLTTSTGGTP